MEFLNDSINIRNSESSFNLPSTSSNREIEESQFGEEILIEVEAARNEDESQQESQASQDNTPNIDSEIIFTNENSQPKNVTRKRKNLSENSKAERATLQCLENISKAANNLIPAQNKVSNENEDDIYGKYIARCLQNIKCKTTKLIVKNKIDQLLFEAQLEDL